MENGYDNRHLDDVKSVRPGDKIVIKSTYTRKRGLPFDNRGVPVSALKIKAVGEVTENPGDGRRLKVVWKPVHPPREWYFYTHRRTVWKVQHSSGALPEASAALIRFALNDEPQDHDSFLRRPFWGARYGFGWTAFFSDIADKLLQYRNEDRGPLITKLIAISRSVEITFPDDRFADGTEGDLLDICPFSTFGCFNRYMQTDTKRDSFANELASFLQVRRRAPTLNWNEDGIPTLDPMRTWFFSHAKDRNPDDIGSLWNVFADAIKLADAGDEDDDNDCAAFIRSYDKIDGVKGVGTTTLAIGLYWIRPWSFPPLDKRSIKYMNEKLGEQVPEKPNAQDYLGLRDRLLEWFDNPDAPVHSFPELTRSAYNQSAPNGDGPGPEPLPPTEYTIDDIIGDGCFLSREALEKVLRRLRTRKNLILQGPPGTGKTWLAKKLAFALLGRKDEGRIRHLQFHPNLSYEDFVRGHRPVEGRLELTDGPLLKLTEEARDDPDHAYVMVIEEINRGNPAQIFGEMLTLLEADKRTPAAALELAFPRAEDERVHVPPNVYLIGTMNVADRSLALVDLALRRRFAFVDLEPVFGESWRRWMRDHAELDDAFLRKIEQRMIALNDEISADHSLGKQFRVGHSYLTVPPKTRIASPEAWYREAVETEIGPLLREYWFDQPDKADAREKHLLADF